MHLIRIASTPWLHSRADLRAVHMLGGVPPRVLGTLAGPWVAPALSPRLPTPVALGRVVRSLGGRMVVANPNLTARLPREVVDLARAVLAARLEGRLGRAGSAPGVDGDGRSDAPPRLMPMTRAAADERRMDALLNRLPTMERARLADEGPMPWVAAALLEPQPVDVQLAAPGGDGPTAPARFVAEACYRLVLAAGVAPPTWESIEAVGAAAPAAAWPPGREHVAWFATTLLIPDKLAAGEMDDATLARWATLTGRASPTSRDRYWFAESWERFSEPGRLVGHVTPQLVARSRHSGRSSGAFDVGGALALTPHVERGLTVPPGYCLVECVGTLEVVVVTA